MTTEQIKLFRPSNGPALELCSHFESVAADTPNAERGTGFHAIAAELLRLRQAGKKLSPAMAGVFKDQCDYALSVQQTFLPEIRGIEEEVALYQSIDGERIFVTSGTIDLWGNGDQRLALVDWKTGQERPYGAQAAVYGLALLEQLDQTEIDLHLAFVDQKRTFSETRSIDDLRQRVNALIETLRDPASPYSINAYCAYCDLRSRCPAWDSERELVAQFSDSGLSLAEKIAILKRDPEKLGRFLVAFRRLKNMVEKIERLDQVALEYLEKGTIIEGLSVISRAGLRSVAPSKIKELIYKVSPQDLDGLLKADLEMAMLLWKKHMAKAPFPEITVGSPTKYVALKK